MRFIWHASESIRRRATYLATAHSQIETRNAFSRCMIPVVAELRAHSPHELGDLVRHPGEEYAYVLEGEVDLHTSLYMPAHLRAGDSIYFDSGMGHAYHAARERPCRVLSIWTVMGKQKAEGRSLLPC